MGLELESPTMDDGPNPEFVDFTRRFWVGVVLTVPLLILTMGPILGLPVREVLGERMTLWIEFILATPVVLWSGWPFLLRGGKSFRSMRGSFILLSLAVSAKDETEGGRMGRREMAPGT